MNGRTYCVHGLETSTSGRHQFSPSCSLKFNEIPQYSGFFLKTDKLILNFMWKRESPKIAKIILEKKTVGGIFSVKAYKIATGIKIV